MGTKVQSKIFFIPGHYSMRDLNEDSSSYGWPPYYVDKLQTYMHYYNGYSPRAIIDTSAGCDKDIVKKTVFEHEAIFKKQVYELHRLYRIQRDLMEETKRRELHRNQYTEGTSFSPRPSTSQISINDCPRSHVPRFLSDSFSARSLVAGVENNDSPLVSVEEDNRQDGPYAPQHRASERDTEVLESRPSKMRRNFFDLQLPADAYVDSDESDKFSDEKGSRNCKVGPQIGLKLLDCDSDKERRQEDTSRSEQFMRNNGLADLNEPFGMVEINVSGYIDPLGQSSHPVANGFLSPPASKENLLSARRGNGYELQNSQSLLKSENGREYISLIFEEGHGEVILLPIFHGSQQGKLSSLPQMVHKMHDEVNDSSSGYKADLQFSDLGISKSCHETSNNKHLDSLLSLHKPSSFSASPSSNLAVAESWSHSVTSWEMPRSSYNHKSMSTQIYSCLNSSMALSTNEPFPGYTNGITSEAWPSNSNSKSNVGFGCEYPVQNGFYHGSSSGSREVAILSHDYLKCSESKVVSKWAVNLDSAGCCKSLNFNDVTLSNGSFNKLIPERNPTSIDIEKKQEAPLAMLPWLRTRAAYKNGEPFDGRLYSSADLSYVQASSISKKDGTKWGVNGTTSVPCSSDYEGRRTKIGDSSCSKRILGVPIFEKTYTSKNNSSSLTCPVSAPKPSEDVVVKKQKIRELDINLPCDVAVAGFGEPMQRENVVERGNCDTRVAKFSCQIDLNLSVTDEVSVAPTPSGILKMIAVIDLETPAVSEMEEDAIPEVKEVEIPLASPHRAQRDAKQPQDELMMEAAEVIVAMSSAVCNNGSDDVVDMASNQSETSIMEPLEWFVDVVSSCFDNLEEMLDASFECKHGQCNQASSSEEIDTFESMTLRQAETKEEDYMPQPLVPENFKLEELRLNLLPKRLRRGPARRGRQRRDFQRDILPGLASLSRHEMTEDLQTFGGFMRATGHSWNSGLSRRSSTRSGCGRGGRRPVTASSSPPATANVPCTPSSIQLINNAGVVFDDRNLTGWGKTLRRPLRQRCAAAGNPRIPLT